MTQSEKNWRDLFVGRKEELDWLKERWAKALEGQPQLVVLLAETGLGKTRIAQEFYRWLSREQDSAGGDHPQGYWPDAFGSDRESLDVNPSFDPSAGTKAEIPWLWWGLRWENPGNRNQIDDRCALSTYRSALLPHTQAIEAKKQIRAIGKKAVWQLAETAASSVVPWAFALKDLFELGKDYRDARKLSESSVLDPGSQRAAQEITLKDLALNDFRIILDPGEKDAPTVPVVLLLDDAQWADSTSLAFVRELFAEAVRKRWKLMVILTHWEQEWNIGPAAIDPKDGSITHARQLTAELKLVESWQSDCVRIVHPLPEAEEIVRYAFPGLTEAQRRMVVEKSGGNAEMLKEALLWFESEPRFFVRNDRNQALSDLGEKRLAEREFELAQFIRKRYERLSDSIRRSLGWSSAQGTRFLAEITRAAAELMIRSDPEKFAGQIQSGEVIDALSQAEHPHSWIGFEGDRSRKNLAVFRQRVFWEVAKNDLEFDPDERCRVEFAIRDVLTSCLESGELVSLPSAERLDALLIARRILRSTAHDTVEGRLAWARIMVLLFHEYRAEFLNRQVIEVAKDWFDSRPECGWSFEEIPFWDQFGILWFLCQWQDRLRSVPFVDELISRCRSQIDAKGGRDNYRYLSAVLSIRGDLHFMNGEWKAARELFSEGLANSKLVLSNFGPHAEILRELCVMYERVGNVDFINGNWIPAKESYMNGLAILKRMESEYYLNSQLLRDLGVSLNKVGDLELALGNRIAALAKYSESLDIRRSIISHYGVGPLPLRDLGASLNRVGDIQLDLGYLPEARLSFSESLEISRKILNQYGVSPQSLMDLSISLEKMGDIDLADGLFFTKRGDVGLSESKFIDAKSVYSESLAIRRQILADSGEAPELLRALSVSLINVGNIELLQRNRNVARRYYQESLEIRRQILDDYHPRPESLRDVFVSELIFAEMDHHDGKSDEAIIWLDLAKSRLTEIRDRGWATAKTDFDERYFNQQEKMIRNGSS